MTQNRRLKILEEETIVDVHLSVPDDVLVDYLPDPHAS